MYTVPATAAAKLTKVPRESPQPHVWDQAAPFDATALASTAVAAAAAAVTEVGVGGKSFGTGGRGGSYARLFGLKHPRSHRRVDVDPLGSFKKNHYRVSKTTKGGDETEVGKVGRIDTRAEQVDRVNDAGEEEGAMSTSGKSSSAEVRVHSDRRVVKYCGSDLLL